MDRAPRVNALGLSKADYAAAPSTLCKGCGHNSVAAQLIQVAYELNLRPHDVIKLSGIGCSSKSPAYFLGQSHGFNSLHGRMPSLGTGALQANHNVRAIGISGTHGKSTTTGMAATLLLALDPASSVQLGASLPAIEGGYRYGTGEWLVAEVDESDPGFAQLRSSVAVLTNLDDDHVAGDYDERRNYYGSYDELKAAALTFAEQGERLVYCHDWQTLRELVGHHPQAVSYGQDAAADYHVSQVQLGEQGA